MKKMDWLRIFENSSDQTIMMIMDSNEVYVDENGYLHVNNSSYQTSSFMLSRINRIKEQKKIIDRDKNIDRLIEKG
jgi:hypothetical protein